MGDGVGFDVGFTGVGLSLLVFVSASGFSPDNIREVLLTGITGIRSESGVTVGSKMSLLVQNDSIFVTIGSKRFSFVLFATRNGPFVCEFYASFTHPKSGGHKV